MIDWQDKVERGRLVCQESGHAITPGEYYVSALFFDGNRFFRQDYADEVWNAAIGASAISWWRHRRPAPHKDQGPRLVNLGLLLAIFNDIKDARDRHQQCFAWLLGLLLMRRKRLRYLDLVKEGERTFLLLEERDAKVVHKIADPQMTSDEEEAVRENLAEIFEHGVAPDGDGEA